jgi:hypothetical protein
MTITLSGYSVQIDEEDEELVCSYRWYASERKTCVYFRSAIYSHNSQKNISLHRTIMKAVKFQIVDHINGDTLDNRKCNLRIVSHEQNNFNRTRTDNTGITKTCTGRWQVRITAYGKDINIGNYSDIREARAARAGAEIVLFGEYSPLICRAAPEAPSAEG